MSEGNAEITGFLAHWFSGFQKGLETLDEQARREMLGACGRACARSYTIRAFQEAKVTSGDLDSFLANLADRFPGATYERVGEGTVRARYATCLCDLVVSGWVRSPLLCDCSAYNLKENFEQALGIPVEVTIESSILRGGAQCSLLVTLGVA